MLHTSAIFNCLILLALFTLHTTKARKGTSLGIKFFTINPFTSRKADQNGLP